MLWYKAWLETRWRFVIGLALLMVSACGTVLYYPEVMKLMPMASTLDAGGEIGRRIREGVELARSYRGYVWSQWFRQNVTQMLTLLAVLLGSGSPLSQGSGGAALFTLSLPVSRNRLLAVRAATGLAELFALAFVPSLLIPLLSPAIGETYGVGSALIHGVCLFVAGTAFFSLAFLLSTVFADLWRPLLVACTVGVVLSLGEQFVGDLSPFGIFHLMSGEAYFRRGGLPWLELLASAALSMAMLYAATRNIARQDF
jgi:ABC-2 type transport system permease protein